MKIILLSKTVVTDEHHFYDFWGVKANSRSKKLTLGFEWSTLRSKDHQHLSALYCKSTCKDEAASRVSELNAMMFDAPNHSHLATY